MECLIFTITVTLMVIMQCAGDESEAAIDGHAKPYAELRRWLLLMNPQIVKAPFHVLPTPSLKPPSKKDLLVRALAAFIRKLLSKYCPTGMAGGNCVNQNMKMEQKLSTKRLDPNSFKNPGG